MRGSCFLGDGLFERRQRARVARFEHRLRGVVALAGIGRQQRQAAERRVDGAAQPVVDARPCRDRPAGRRRPAVPVAASISLPASSLDDRPSCRSALNISWPSCRARRMASARGLPLAATALMPASVSSKSSAVNWASASSRRAGVRRRAAERQARRPTAERRGRARPKHASLNIPGNRCGKAARAAFPQLSSRRDAARGYDAAALLGDGVVVAALELDPVGHQVLRARQIVATRRRRDQVLGLPHHVELAVGPDLADIDRLGDVMVRQQRRDAAGQVRRLRCRAARRSPCRDRSMPAFSTAFTHMLKPM